MQTVFEPLYSGSFGQSRRQRPCVGPVQPKRVIGDRNSSVVLRLERALPVVSPPADCDVDRKLVDLSFEREAAPFVGEEFQPDVIWEDGVEEALTASVQPDHGLMDSNCVFP